MLHLGKYFGYILHGGFKVLTYPFKVKKYVKNKDEYPLKERYALAREKIIEVVDDILRIKLEVEGLEKIDRSNSTYLFVPNHQGMLDPLCLIKLFDSPLIIVSKKEVRKYPIVGKIDYIIDSIFLDRENPRDALNMVKKCKEHLHEGRNVVIFAEGTRSKDENISIHTYKPGAFKCVYGTGCKIVPVVIDKSYIPLSTKIKNTDKVIKIKFLDPINADEYEKLNTNDLALMIENRAKDTLEIMRKSN